MIGMTDRPSIGAIFAAFTATGSKPPKAVAAAHDRLTGILERFDRRPLPDRDALSLAVLAALDAGTDPAVSPEVQNILASDAIASRHPLGEEIRGTLTDQLRTTCRDHADAIVAAWRPGFGQAATDLTEAHHTLGPIDLGDTDLIVRRGPDATAAWSKAQRATDTIATAAAGWAGLMTFTTGALLDRRYRMATVAEVEPPRWLDLELDHQSADPWAVLGHGLNLALPTFAEHRAILAAIEAERAGRAERAESARRDAFSGRRRALTT